ncbi:MAG: hypothetical protein AB9836_00975 [Aminipila sp.]
MINIAELLAPVVGCNSLRRLWKMETNIRIYVPLFSYVEGSEKGILNLVKLLKGNCKNIKCI